MWGRRSGLAPGHPRLVWIFKAPAARVGIAVACGVFHGFDSGAHMLFRGRTISVRHRAIQPEARDVVTVLETERDVFAEGIAGGDRQAWVGTDDRIAPASRPKTRHGPPHYW